MYETYTRHLFDSKYEGAELNTCGVAASAVVYVIWNLRKVRKEQTTTPG